MAKIPQWMGYKKTGGSRVVSVQLPETQWQETASSYLLRMPPRSEALRHSGGERRLFTSAMVTLYLEVELRRDNRPGTEQNKSVGLTTQVPPWEGKMYVRVSDSKRRELCKRYTTAVTIRHIHHVRLLQR